MPLVSVLMPVYNGQAFLAEAIASVLGQSMCDFELVIVNDGSTDASKRIIDSFADGRIRYHENERNLGLIATLNRGVGYCRGRYIARMDADDVCEPQRLERQVRFLDRHPRVGLCGTWAGVIDGVGRVTGRVVNQTDPQMVSVALLFTVPVLHPSVMCRAELMREHPYGDVPLAEDYDLWCRLADVSAIANLPERLMRYRWHESNVSKEKQALQQQNTEAVIRHRLAALGLQADKETMRIHRLSFTLYAFNDHRLRRITREDLQRSEQWFATLLDANARVRRYDANALRAFLWARHLVLCRAGGLWRFLPRFASLHPAVLKLLAGQLSLLSKK